MTNHVIETLKAERHEAEEHIHQLLRSHATMKARYDAMYKVIEKAQEVVAARDELEKMVLKAEWEHLCTEHPLYSDLLTAVNELDQEFITQDDRF